MTATLPASAPLTIMLVAGEPSGDALGAQLMRGLQAIGGSNLRLIGVGGREMRREGLQSLYDISDTAVIGARDALPRLRILWNRARQCAEMAVAQNVDAVVMIDSTDFMRWVAGRIKKRAPHILRVKYVSPQIWASRPGRAKALTRVFDHILCLFPFEPKFYEAVNLPATFVGNPVVERRPPPGLGEKFRAAHGIAPLERLIVMLPGSRASEVRFLWPDFRAAIDMTLAAIGPCRVAIPVVPTVAPAINDLVKSWGRDVILIYDDQQKWGAFEAADAALTKTGTITTELALAQTPMVSAYKAGRITAWVARRIMTVKHLNMLNLVLDRTAIPELIQQDCTPANLAQEMTRLIKDPQARATQAAAAQEALRILGAGQPPASERSARAIMDLIAARRRANNGPRV
jgi:lipid-A-disaccharide synthase